MSTARIVSLVVAGIGFVAAIGLFAYASSLSTITYVGGQFALDREAVQQASGLNVAGGLLALVALGGFVVFLTLTVRDRKQQETTTD